MAMNGVVDAEDERKSSKGFAVDVNVEPRGGRTRAGQCRRNPRSSNRRIYSRRSGEATRAAIHEPEDDEKLPLDDYPDGGLRAWLVLMGVCTSVFSGN